MCLSTNCMHLDCAVYKSLCCTCVCTVCLQELCAAPGHFWVYVEPGVVWCTKYCVCLFQSTRALCCTWTVLSICWTWSCLVHKILCLFVSKPFYVCFGCFDTGSKHRNIPRNYVLVSWNKLKNNRNRLRFGSFRFFQFLNTLLWKINKSCLDIGKRSPVSVRNTLVQYLQYVGINMRKL